jgi:hypothetical protein
VAGSANRAEREKYEKTSDWEKLNHKNLAFRKRAQRKLLCIKCKQHRLSGEKRPAGAHFHGPGKKPCDSRALRGQPAPGPIAEQGYVLTIPEQHRPVQQEPGSDQEKLRKPNWNIFQKTKNNS